MMYMYYPCGKFGDCSFGRFGLSCGQTNRHTDTNERFTPATLVGVSKKYEWMNEATIGIKQ